MATGRPPIDLSLPHYSDDFNTNYDPFAVRNLLDRDIQSFGGLDAYGGEATKLTWSNYSGQSVSRGGVLYAKQTSGIAEPSSFGMQIKPFPGFSDNLNYDAFISFTRRMSDVTSILEGGVTFPIISDPHFDQWSGQSLPVLDAICINSGFNFPYEVFMNLVLEFIQRGEQPADEEVWNRLVGPSGILYQSVLLYGVQCRTFGQLTESDISEQEGELNSAYPGVGSIVFNQMSPGDGLMIFMNTVDNYLLEQTPNGTQFTSELLIGRTMSFYKIAPGGSFDFYSGRDRSFVYGDVTNKSQMSFLYGIRLSADMIDNSPGSVSVTPMANEGDTQLNYDELSRTIFGERYHGPYFYNPGTAPEHLYGLGLTATSFAGLNWINGGGRKLSGGWKIDRRGIG